MHNTPPSPSRRFQLGHHLSTRQWLNTRQWQRFLFVLAAGTLEIESIDNIHDVRFDRVLTKERRVPHGMNTHQDEDHTLIRRCKLVLMIHPHKCDQTTGISHGKSEPSVDHGGVVFYRSSRHHLLSFQDKTYVFETSRKTRQDRGLKLEDGSCLSYVCVLNERSNYTTYRTARKAWGYTKYKRACDVSNPYVQSWKRSDDRNEVQKSVQCMSDSRVLYSHRWSHWTVDSSILPPHRSYKCKDWSRSRSREAQSKVFWIDSRWWHVQSICTSFEPVWRWSPVWMFHVREKISWERDFVCLIYVGVKISLRSDFYVIYVREKVS